MPLDGVDGVDGTLSTLLLFEIAISSGITIIVLVATWLVVRRGMRPLERMGATARTIAATGLGTRVSPFNEKTEVGRLGLALNEMLGQIERAFAQRDVTEQQLAPFRLGCIARVAHPAHVDARIRGAAAAQPGYDTR